MVLISNGLLVVLPLVFRQAVQSLNFEVQVGRQITLWVVILTALAAASAYFMYRMRVEFVAVSRDVEREVRSMLFDRLQAQSRAFYDRHHIGDLMSVLTNDIASYREVLGPGIMYPLFFATMVIPSLVAMYMISPPMTMLSLIPILLLPLFILVTQKKVYIHSKEVQDVLGEMSTFAQEHFSAIRLVKSTATERQSLKQFDTLGEVYARLNIWLAAIRGLFFPFLTLFTRAVTLALVLFAGYSIFYHWTVLSSADFVSFMWIQSNIFGPVLMLGWVLPIYQRGAGAYSRMVDLYEEPIQVQEGSGVNLDVPPQADIELRDLTFSYPMSTTPALKEVSVTIKGGSFVGITGPVASGKTTLFRLLNREYEIPRNKIFVGGHDIRDYRVEFLRRSMGVVEQAPFLFSQTVAENVGIGCEVPLIEDIQEVSRLADLHDSVMGFPGQYETVVGERGVRLSGGQKQRVALARVFLVRRGIFLLDDVFSAVDTVTERRIFNHMREAFSGKTVLLVTHRTALLRQMDRILYMEDGQIKEDGTHEELLALGGSYAALVELQSLATEGCS